MPSVRTCGRTTALHIGLSVLILFIFTTHARAQADIVLHARDAAVTGNWQIVPDPAAAGGSRAWNPDLGLPKLGAALAAPADYIELSFHAEAGRGYRLWLRGRADNNGWTNDSVFVQFSGSVSAAGAPVYRIATTDATVISIEEGSARGLSGWGWQDNGYDSVGPLVYFAATGPQTVRIQRREDGISIDQIVLSSATYLASAPGAAKNDTTLLTRDTGAPVTPAPTADIVFGVANPAAIQGDWRLYDDATAAGGKAVGTPNLNLPKVATASANPASFVDYTFQAEAGRPYRLWLRGRAESDYWANDSIFVQFSGSETTSGAPVARIGTTDAYVVNLEDAGSAGVAGWGWQDNGYGTGVLGPLVVFGTSGVQTIRFQAREDGFRIDQVVLSSAQYLTTAPGALKNDTTVIAGAASSPTNPTPTPTDPPPTQPPPPTSGPVQLRILEWNLHHGVGTDNVYNIDRIATWMAAVRPDIVLLNEVEKFTGWGNEDQPERYRTLLEAKTGRTWYSRYFNEYGNWSGHGKGHQILSTIPIDSSAGVVISYQRVIGQATITVNGRALNLLVTHLDPYDQAVRLAQAKEVTAWAAGFAENRILAGDMNAWPDQSSIAEFNSKYNDAWTMAERLGKATGVPGIYPFGATKNGRIDYIFLSKGAADLTVLDMTVIDTRDPAGRMPSDHRPILTTVEVR